MNHVFERPARRGRVDVSDNERPVRNRPDVPSTCAKLCCRCGVGRHQADKGIDRHIHVRDGRCGFILSQRHCAVSIGATGGELL